LKITITRSNASNLSATDRGRDISGSLKLEIEWWLSASFTPAKTQRREAFTLTLVEGAK